MAAPNSTIVPTSPRNVEATSEGASKQQDQYQLTEEEYAGQSTRNLTFDEEEVEPELHARTYVAIAAMILLNYTQVMALQGPAAVVSYYPGMMPQILYKINVWMTEMTDMSSQTTADLHRN